MRPRIHVFAVALETYQKTAIDPVAYAENDARDFVMAWQALGADPTDCVTLLSTHATKTAIESSFKKFLNGVAKGDTVVFFFAGHGIAYNDVSYLTTHDTQPGDIKLTSISLALILKQIRESKSDRVLLFIDACESGLPISAGMRSITSDFSGEEMRQFCEDASHHFGFAACKVDESSWPSSSLKHGIWSYLVIEALSGRARDALEKGNLVTSDSLRDYLAQEVPRLLRKTRIDNEIQTPCSFGNATKQFIVADLRELLAKRAAQATDLGLILKDSFFRGQRLGEVRTLSGFQKAKGHHEPDGHTSATEGFVRHVGFNEVKERAKALFQQLRNSFAYKRADLDYRCSDGSATIKTPDFDVNVWIEQDPDDASAYRLVSEVGAFRKPSVVGEDRFLDLFSAYCDTFVIRFSTNFPVKKKIDEIEKIPHLADGLDYDAEASWFTLEMDNPDICIRVTEDSMTLSLVKHLNLKQLLANSNKAISALGGSGLTLLLPDKT